MWLRRRQQAGESRGPLRAARDTFDALGADAWAERSGRPALRVLDLLAPQELQIARLAAEGLSNREIGQQLYLSHRTVRNHLYRIFPKLGITSRTELGAVVGASLDPAQGTAFPTQRPPPGGPSARWAAAPWLSTVQPHPPSLVAAR